MVRDAWRMDDIMPEIGNPGCGVGLDMVASDSRPNLLRIEAQRFCFAKETPIAPPFVSPHRHKY